MPLIKNAQSARLINSAVVLDLGDLDRQAQRILENAKAKARKTLDEAKEKSDKLIANADAVGHAQGLKRGLEEGREQGRKEGHEQAIAELRPQLQQIVESWTAALEQWEASRSEMLLSAKEDALAFAVAMGEKIIFRTIEVDPSIVEDQLADALALLSQPSAVTITVNPADRDLVEEVLPELMRSADACKHASVSNDPEITRGGCIVRTAGGEVDATIETQLDRIVEAVLPWTREEDHASLAEQTSQ